jgi:hypothetical protein
LQYYSFNQGDKDKNGVRDDIDYFINNNFEQENYKKSLRLYSHFYWNLTTPNLERESFLENYRKKLSTMNCIWFLSASYGYNSENVINNLDDRHINSFKNHERHKYFLQRGAFYRPRFEDFEYSDLLAHPEKFCLFELENRDRLIKLAKKAKPGY